MKKYATETAFSRRRPTRALAWKLFKVERTRVKRIQRAKKIFFFAIKMERISVCTTSHVVRVLKGERGRVFYYHVADNAECALLPSSYAMRMYHYKGTWVVDTPAMNGRLRATQCVTL